MRKRSAALFKSVCVVFSVCTLVLCVLWRVRLAQAEENIAALEDALKEAETHKKELLTEAKSYSGAVLRTVDLLNETEELKKFCGKTGKNF